MRLAPYSVYSKCANKGMKLTETNPPCLNQTAAMSWLSQVPNRGEPPATGICAWQRSSIQWSPVVLNAVPLVPGKACSLTVVMVSNAQFYFLWTCLHSKNISQQGNGSTSCSTSVTIGEARVFYCIFPSFELKNWNFRVKFVFEWAAATVTLQDCIFYVMVEQFVLTLLIILYFSETDQTRYYSYKLKIISQEQKRAVINL
jgi:hypothetical protein